MRRRCPKGRLLFPWALSLFFSFAAMGQTALKVTGVVRTEEGEPLIGVTVTETGTKNAVTTNNKGVFSISVKKVPTQLTVSYVGYQTRTVAGSGDVSVVLSTAKGNMTDVVVVGYQSQKKKEITAAVSTIKGEEIENIPEASFDEMIQGRLAGVAVQSSTGEPGAKPNIVIRGATNLDYANSNGGNTGPLYVIDGVIYDLNNMNGSSSAANPLSLIDPNDIESVTVLKDASASAIYGARGGNGVIIVQTKRAKRLDKPQVQASVFTGATVQTNLKPVITGDAERALKLRLLLADGGASYSDLLANALPLSLTDSLNPAFNGDVNWQGLTMRSFALVNNEDASVSSFFGNNNSYRVSLNHYDEQGAVKGFSVERMSPDITLTLNPIRHFTLRTDLRLSAETHHHGAGTDANPFLFSSWNFPTSLVTLSPQTAALYSGTQGLYDDDKIFSFIGNVVAIDTITPNLTITSNYSATNYTDKYNYFVPATLNGIMNTAYDNDASNPDWSWENYLTWDKRTKDHHLSVVGGYSAYEANQYYTYASAAGINVSGIYTLQTVPPGANLYVSTSKSTKTTESYYARAQYAFKDRYFATASFRRDASSIYSPSYRWGTFPAFSLGWATSDEAFFAPLRKTISSLKFRASWGITGLDPGTWYAKYQTLYDDASFFGATTGVIGGAAASPYLTGTPATYNGTTVVSPFPYGNNYIDQGAVKSSNTVRWEKFPQWNFGMDADFFNGRIDLTTDIYQKNGKDQYLWSVPADPTTGYFFYAGNYAGVCNRGLEITLFTRNLGSHSKFQWNTNFNISFNKNFVTQLPNGNQDLLFGDPWFRKSLTLGAPLFTYRLWQVNGVYPTNASVPTDPITGQKMTYFGTPLQAGDSRIVDQNGDYNIDYNDQVSSGKSANPKATGGILNTFIYKGFSLSVFASFSYGNEVLNGNLSDALNGSVNYTSSWNSVAGPAALGNLLNQFWQQPGDQTKYPRLVYPANTVSQVDPWNISRSYFLEPGGFIKIKQVKLGYNLPQSVIRSLGIRGLNVYGMAENLHIFKQAKDIPDPELYDPTTGSVNILYPSGVKFTIGLITQLQ